MKPLKTLLVSTAVAATLAGGASAHSNHMQGTPDDRDCAARPAMGMHDSDARGHDMMQMMHKMMHMHRGMMGEDMPGMAMMSGMRMMHAMGGMLPGLKADANGDGEVTPQELRDRLAALLSEHDADGDGALSLDEFAALHAALIRETMVDRFQFLDDDGDGAVSAAEIAKPARMLERMQAMREHMMKAAPDMESKRMPGNCGMEENQDGMMQDN